jgi:uncharacterized protein YvpB
MKKLILLLLCSSIFFTYKVQAETLNTEVEVKVSNTREKVILEVENSRGHIILINDANKGNYEKTINNDYEKIELSTKEFSKEIAVDIISIDGLTVFNENYIIRDLFEPIVYFVNEVDSHSRTITGRTEPHTFIEIRINEKILNTQADSAGYFYVSTNLIPANTKIEILATDFVGNITRLTEFRVKQGKKPEAKILDVKLIRQMPELPRGCEVTSLAMMLNYAKVNVNKMTLAREIDKDPTKYRKINGKIYFGNPNTGFVGSMYTFSKPGFGVYNGPIYKLGKKYFPTRIINITGSEFSHLEDYITLGSPVWVITTTSFNSVPKKYWYEWNTPTGKIHITYKEHSVLITGYDNEYLYINDPLYNSRNRKVNKANFIKGWEQFGKQAITFL